MMRIERRGVGRAEQRGLAPGCRPIIDIPGRFQLKQDTLSSRLRQGATSAALALLLAACGGGSQPEPATAPGSLDTATPPALTTLPASALYTNDRLVTLDHGAFVLLYDCTQHTALRYDYTLGADLGTAARPASFTFDPDLPAGCTQQTSTGTYASVAAGWDRGHLVTSNHMDVDASTIQHANYMTNVVPQVASFNQGIWLQAENVAECYRDIAPVRVVGGVIHGDAGNDIFLASHGLPTPEYFWKVILTTDPASGAAKAIAWLIPNQEGLAELASYLVSIAELEQRVGAALVNIDATAELKAGKPAVVWPLPAGCLLG
jgi:endonuclease G